MRTKRQGMVRVRAAALAETLESRELLSATIVGRYAFYGDSPLDTSSTSVQALIAPDKTALLPGQTSSFANYTSYVKGVNGIAIDATNWPATPVASDFAIKAGNNASPANWTTITQTATFSIEHGAGTGGSDRIIVRLPDNTYRNQWVQVTVNPTADTGLSSPDIFYFGNAVGDDGHGVTNAIVDASDEAGARRGSHGFTGTAPTADLYDFNRDGRVDITDQLIARASVNTAATALQYFTVPAAVDPGATGNFAAVFNVRSYGATGNGTSDDAPAINAAVAALTAAGHGLLYFPAGTYNIKSFIYIKSLNNFEIRGAGATLKAASGLETTDTFGDLLRVDGCSNFTISGLTFDANAAQRTQTENPSSLRLQGASFFRVTNCTFNNTVADAIYVCAWTPGDDSSASRDGVIEGCTINSAWRNGISIIHAYRVQVESNLIQNVAGTAPQSGIDIEANSNDTNGANHNLAIIGNRFQNIANNGVLIPAMQNTYSITIDSNNFSNAASAVFNAGINTVIDNNNIHDFTNPTSGVISYGMICSSRFAGQHVEIAGNNLYSLANVTAIIVDQWWIGSAFVSDNHLSNLTGGNQAIALNQPNAVVTANTVVNCGGQAIAVTGYNADVENNAVSTGPSTGIFMSGSGMTVRNNTVSNFTIGLFLTDNAATGATAPASLVNANTIAGCPTGLMSALINSQITSNTFGNVTKPTSGPGSDAAGEILLLSTTNGTATISNNTLVNINGVTAINIVPNWTGYATISGNRLSNIGATAISTAAPSTVTNNTITNSLAGIGISANNCDVESNTITGGNGYGIYAYADGLICRYNNISGQNTGVQLLELATPVAGLYTVVDSNTFTGCSTAVYDTMILSTVTSNLFQNATKPASGSGSDAQGQVYVLGVANGIVNLSGNTFNNINNVTPIFLHSSWKGTATVNGNQISNLQGPVAGMVVNVDNAAVTNNTLQNGTGGISVSASGAHIENNTITAQGGGIYAYGTNNFVRYNSLTDSGDPAIGQCIFVAYGTHTTILGNTLRKTIANPVWVPIVYNGSDVVGVNYAYGIGNFNGAFTPGSAAVPAQDPILSTPVMTTPIVSTPIDPTPVVTTPIVKRPARRNSVLSTLATSLKA